MEITYVYTKPRCKFGRPCHFSCTKGTLNATVEPDPMWASIVVHPKVCNRSIQCAPQMSANFVETEVHTNHDKGIQHREGGWPKDVNREDMDQKLRYRKKIERDENYVNSIVSLGNAMVHCLQQNNAVNIYGRYFSEYQINGSESPPKASLISQFRPLYNFVEPAVDLSWSPGNPDRIAVAHCSLKFGETVFDQTNESYIWDLNDTLEPELKLKPQSPVVCLQHNPRDTHVLIGGCYSGQIVSWDLRKGGSSVSISNMADSHQDVAWKVKWIQSKTGSEFISASTDGRVLWWDMRKLSTPFEELILDPTKKQNIETAEGAYALDYEATVPTKLMVGTEYGRVFLCNRKGRIEDKVSHVYDSRNGPIYALQRNPFFINKFLTVSDWGIRVWSEEVKDWSIMTTPYSNSNYTDGCWSPVRPAVFMATKHNGTIEIWDLVFSQSSPTIVIQLTDSILNSVSVEETGKLVAAADNDGTVSLLSLPEGLYHPTKKEKPLLMSIFDRETRREKIMELRMKEVKLKMKLKRNVDEVSSATRSSIKPGEDNEKELEAVEEMFFNYLDEMKSVYLEKQSQNDALTETLDRLNPGSPSSTSFFSTSSIDSRSGETSEKLQLDDVVNNQNCGPMCK